jgi:DNA-binding response OmpR family regulator
MSGYPDVTVRHAENLQEHAEVLQKPFSLKSLASRARALLDKSGAVQENRAQEAKIENREGY